MIATIDPSLRYVLDKGSPLSVNLAALWLAEPKLAAEIEKLDDQTAYKLTTARSGVPTLVVKTPDGRSISVHSRYDPVDEAKRLIESSDIGQKPVFCVHGLGLGYHLEELFDQATSEAIILILEPDLRMIRAALEARDLSRMIRSNRIYWFWTFDKGALLTRMIPHSALFSVGLCSILHPPSLQLQQQAHEQLQEWIKELAAFTRTSLNTLVLNGRKTCENIARNIGWYAAAPSLLRLRGLYDKKPAIIVSAGPSLRKNQHLLKRASSRAVLIAVQTMLQPLLDMGVEPQFVTSLDYHEICTRFFEKLPPTLRTELVVEPKATSAIFAMHPGPLSLLGNELADKLIREMKMEKARLRSGATVAHLAYYLAEHLGCDPIIFVGQDLGFSDGLCYTPGTSYEDVWRPELSRFCTVEMKQWEQIMRDRPILRRIPDYQGRPMYTEERLFSYLQQFERDFATTSAQIIDATEGGAMKRGASAMPLADALERFCAKPLDLHRCDHPGYRWDLLDAAADCLCVRQAEARRIESISRQTLPLLQEIHDHIEDQPRVNRCIACIDRLRAQVNDLNATYDLVTQMTQITELARFRLDRQIAAERLAGTELQKRQVARDIANVRGVADAAVAFAELMSDAITRTRSLASQKLTEAAA